MADLVFWIIAAVTIMSAAFVVLNNQLIYSAVALLFTLFGVAGLYVFLWADFIAGIQILVYVGGILVLVIFGIMLTNKIDLFLLFKNHSKRDFLVPNSLPIIDVRRL